MNLIHIIGYLGKDPEESCTPNGRKLWTLVVATRVRGRKGEEETIWWRLTIWGDEYDKMLQHLGKGRPVYAVAEINRKFGTYTDKNGQTQVSYEATVRSLHFVPVGTDRQPGTEGQQQGGYAPQQATQQHVTHDRDQSNSSTDHAYSGSADMGGGYSSMDDDQMPF